MNITLRGYYGFKNVGDELLLLGLLNYLYKDFTVESFTIIGENKSRMEEWIFRHRDLLNFDIDKIIYEDNIPIFIPPKDLLVLGGGEVVTASRPFPHNGWNYLRHLFSILFGRHMIVGGLGEAQGPLMKMRYRFLLGRAERVVTRNPASYEIARQYHAQSELYHDYALDILDIVQEDASIGSSNEPYLIININKHILNQSSLDSIAQEVVEHPDHDLYFFPGSIGSDDADATLLDIVGQVAPGIQLYDRTRYSMQEIYEFVAKSDLVVGARLHVLVLAKHAGVPFRPLVYQEKVQRLLDEIDEDGNLDKG